jgi:hypothetical protein
LFAAVLAFTHTATQWVEFKTKSLTAEITDQCYRNVYVHHFAPWLINAENYKTVIDKKQAQLYALCELTNGALQYE